jgi:DNA polymerase alpha-associated DNA helicase A
MNNTMERLLIMSESEYSSFVRVLFGLTSPAPVPENLTADPEFGKIEWIDPTLNDSQKEAIRFALASKEIALIHGPPGVSRSRKTKQATFIYWSGIFDTPTLLTIL